MKTTAKIAIFSILLLSAVLVVSHFMPSQDNSKNTIRVLIDRYPQSQSVDVVFQKIKPLIDELGYRLSEFPDEERMLLSHSTRPALEFKVVRDEVTRALLFLRGDADVLYDTLSLAKTEWLRKKSASFQVVEAPGFTLSYLGFQTRHPILKNVKVREAIAMALPVDEWIKHKFFNWVARDSEITTLPFDPVHSAKLLDEAGYPMREGLRFSLRYFTTPVREGNETAQLVREALKQVGIEVNLVTLETALFFDKIQKGDFDLFSSRWVRLSKDASAVELFGKGQRKNYTHYENDELEKIFAKNPNTSLTEIASVISSELPLVALYNWKHGLVTSPRIRIPADIAVSIDETFRFLSRLEIK